MNSDNTHNQDSSTQNGDSQTSTPESSHSEGAGKQKVPPQATRGAGQVPPEERACGEGNKTDWKEPRADYEKGSKVKALGVMVSEILFNTRRAFVFLDEKGGVQWLYRDEPPNSGWIFPRVVELEAKCGFFRQSAQPMYVSMFPFLRLIPFFSNYRVRSVVEGQKAAQRFIGQGIVVLYSSATMDEVRAAFDCAEKYIELCGRECSLIWLYSTFGLLALFSVIALLWLVFGCWPTSVLPFSVLSCVAAGGIGAFASRALASRTELPCDANAGWYLHFCEALLRWAVGSIAGGLMCLLLPGKVLLGGWETGAGNFSVMLALALFAGMSERFFPTLLNRFDDQITAEKTTVIVKPTPVIPIPMLPPPIIPGAGGATDKTE